LFEEAKLERLRFVFSFDGEDRVENTFQGFGRTRPDARERLAMNGEFSEQAANC
jgi:hypothetical protein